MLQEIETEYKFLLNKERFKSILDKCDDLLFLQSRKLQINYYYDTKENFFSKHCYTIRVRQKNDELKFQVKKHKSRLGALTISNEYSYKLNYLPYKMQLPGMEEPIYFKGSLTTERVEYSIGKHSTICFDYNMYLGICDYEIEIEIVESDKNYVVRFMEKFNLIDYSSKSKYSRFFKRLEEFNNG